MDRISFKNKVWAFYKEQKRILPWRKTRDPFKILVSEIMLQQTQVDRVIPYYQNFLKRFPTKESLSRATVQEVLRLWQGLGYNRRALYLRQAAALLKDRSSFETKLPGVGPYTRNAVRVFAWNEPHVMIETNIRAVFLHEFFPRKKNVSDRTLLPLIERTLDQKNPREWYWALMDYGAHLKKTIENPNKKSAHYVQQSPFKGSRREIRGTLIRSLLKKPNTEKTLLKELSPEQQRRAKEVIADLSREGFLTKKGNLLSIS